MRTVLIFVFAAAIFAVGQQSSTQSTTPSQEQKPAAIEENPATAFNKMAYEHVTNWVLRSAEKMPEESFSFKPTDTVRSFGQILGHVADAQYLFCSSATGRQNPQPNVEKTKTSKADLVAALKDAFAYCSTAYSGMNDKAGAEPVKFFGQDMAKMNVLTANNMHLVEHYGNLVVYLRMKNIVPPSSEPAPAQPQKK